MANLSVKTNKVSISKISINAYDNHELLLEKQRRCWQAKDAISHESLEILLLLHPVIVSPNFELIAGLNSYTEWRKFTLENPLQQEVKFSVLVLKSDLTPSQIKQFDDSQTLTENLFLTKYIPSAQTLLKNASDSPEVVKNFKPSLLKKDGSVNTANFSKELGLKNIRVRSEEPNE
jgi:hypothetical protein